MQKENIIFLSHSNGKWDQKAEYKADINVKWAQVHDCSTKISYD